MSYLSYLKKPKKKQELNALLHVYELYKDVVYSYLNNPTHPATKDLNIFYIRELKPAMLKLAKELHLDAMIAKKEIELSKNYILFTSLPVAGKELQDKGKDSEYARNEVSYNYGKIKELTELAAAVLQEPIPEIEEIIEEGRALINELEFVQTKQKEEGVLYKNKKRVHLPKFPRTEWARVSIKFIDEINILLSDSIETRPYIPGSFGCIDERTKKPDASWKFLIKVAKGGGATEPINKDKRELQKKQKQNITDILRRVFQNDSEPFETRKGGIYAAKFNIEYTREEEEKIPTNTKYLGLEEYKTGLTKSTQENIEHDIRHILKPDKDGEYSQ